MRVRDAVRGCLLQLGELQDATAQAAAQQSTTQGVDVAAIQLGSLIMDGSAASTGPTQVVMPPKVWGLFVQFVCEPDRGRECGLCWAHTRHLH